MIESGREGDWGKRNIFSPPRRATLIMPRRRVASELSGSHSSAIVRHAAACSLYPRISARSTLLRILYANTYACMHVCMYACMHVCMGEWMNGVMYVNTYVVCVCSCMHVWMDGWMELSGSHSSASVWHAAVCMYVCVSTYHVCMWVCM